MLKAPSESDTVDRGGAVTYRTLCYTKPMPEQSRQLTVSTPSRTLAVATRDGIVVPRMIAGAGEHAARRFLEFFAATDPDLSGDGLDRFASQQPQDDVSLARRAPALDRFARRRLGDGG